MMMLILHKIMMLNKKKKRKKEEEHVAPLSNALYATSSSRGRSLCMMMIMVVASCLILMMMLNNRSPVMPLEGSQVEVDDNSNKPHPSSLPSSSSSSEESITGRGGGGRRIAEEGEEEKGSLECLPPYLAHSISREDRIEIEKEEMVWYKNLADNLTANINETSGWAIWDRVFLPTMHNRCQMERMGGEPHNSDGGKWLCGVEELAKVKWPESCVIYSLGSDDNWSFEYAMHQKTKCRIEIFDCTINQTTIPSRMRDRTTFHRLCLGDDEMIGEEKHMSLRSVTEMLGDKSVDILKMDIEDAEFTVLKAMLREEDWSLLPSQIVVEMHYWPKEGRKAISGVMEVGVLAERLHSAGYRALKKEDNFMGECCTEVTLVRLLCPERTYLDVP